MLQAIHTAFHQLSNHPARAASQPSDWSAVSQAQEALGQLKTKKIVPEETAVNALRELPALRDLTKDVIRRILRMCHDMVGCFDSLSIVYSNV